ncbi:ISH6 family transposase [Haloterrigena sp. H1]|uniref:ISH6 family transposase n=1 Tax=Haloterrigena sp. H1 TaxID=2552943 RepID=UPI00110DDE18|nr:ISH6 family transposase [Haloterrigena sp. H1]TMT81386.1 ISH6 family transposase [Haloterrigena sp. H1]TMT81418.1 ISH6 family transposase [Haloterrigena sp. H1]
MHAEINVRFAVSIAQDKTLPLATLAESLTEIQLEATILEELVRSLDERLVEAYCGEKHARGNGDCRFQRAGTSTRTAVTTAGEHEFTLHHVKDTAATDGNPTYFRPLEDLIDFDGQRIYQEDISLQAAELATSLSYRDAVAHGDGFTPMPSITTVNRRVREYGSKLGDFVRDRLPGTNADTVVPDGTKCHSQQDHCTYHDVNVTLGQTAEGDDTETTLLDVNVNESWDETAEALEETEAVTDDATVVSDAEKALVDAFESGDRSHQLDLVHVGRTLGYKLWKDDTFPLSERKAIVSGVTDDLFHLKNSVALHAPRNERLAIRERIDQTLENLGKEAWRLERQDSPKATAYLREWAEATVTFAELALDQQQVPWTSNVVERAMGEVSKRCKNQWMQWSEAGLESLLWLNLVQYADPEQFAAFADELLERSAKTAITMEVSVDATRGEL